MSPAELEKERDQREALDLVREAQRALAAIAFDVTVGRTDPETFREVHGTLAQVEELLGVSL